MGTAVFPGYPPPADLVIDAGVLYYNNSDYKLATAFGTTRDGITFDPGMETREVPYDGQHTAYEGLGRIISWNTVLSGKIITVTPASRLATNPGSSSDGSAGANTITMKKAGNLFQTGDYGIHLWWIGRQQVDGTLFMRHFPLFYVSKYTVSGKHNNEWEVDLSIKAVLPAGSDPQACPFTEVFASA